MLPPRVPRPGSQRTSRRPAVWAGVALLLGTVGLLISPESWAEGTGSLTVAVAGQPVASGPVEVGPGDDLEPVTIDGDRGGDPIEVLVESGAATDSPIDVEVTARSGPPLALDEVEVTLMLGDGSEESVPVVSATDGTVTAVRRPPQDVGVVLGLLGVVMVLWVTGIVPLFVTSLVVPVVLAVGEVGTAGEVLAPFFDPIIVLFFAGFIMAEAMARSGLDRRAATMIVAMAGGGPARLFAALLGTSAFMSMWMSNTAAVAVLIPIALTITGPLAHEGYRRAVVLGIAFAATIGGVGSAIGTPANQLAIRFLDEFAGRQISFVEWFAFGLPLALTLLPVTGFWLWRTMVSRFERPDFSGVRREAIEQRSELGPMSRDERLVLAVLLGVVVLWLSQTAHEVNPGIVALGGAIVLFLTGRAETEDLGRISWPTLLTFGGGLTLGVAMVESGTADWVVTRLGGLADLPSYLGIVAVAAVALLMTTAASNTAAAATLIPLAVPLAGLLGVDPVVLVVVVALATSIDFALVIGTPPTMMAYSTDLFTPADILRRGWPLDLAGLALLVTVVLGWWVAIGLV